MQCNLFHKFLSIKTSPIPFLSLPILLQKKNKKIIKGKIQPVGRQAWEPTYDPRGSPATPAHLLHPTSLPFHLRTGRSRGERDPPVILRQKQRQHHHAPTCSRAPPTRSSHGKSPVGTPLKRKAEAAPEGPGSGAASSRSLVLIRGVSLNQFSRLYDSLLFLIIVSSLVRA